ncbi:MAG TPA: glutaredoxin family protein [Verrucomicrobiales bacterium]|nr:glutaredoxin family protein [Verrucomicrobiales bacterium]
MPEDPELKVYIKPGCPWCVDAVAYLKKDGFSFRTIDVIADPAMFREMREISGQSCAPTLTYGELMLADFGVEEMQEFFNKHNIAP